MFQSSLPTLFLAYLKEWCRSKTAIFWSQLFPLIFIVGFPYIFAGGQPDRVVFIVPGVLTINLLAASFFGVSMNVVTLRETGILRRYQVTPLRPITLITAFGLTSLVSILVSMIIQMGVAMILFRIPVSFNLGIFVLVYLISAFAFIPLGLLVGSAAKDSKTAPAITNVLFFPMMFLSGAAIPLFLMPAWIRSSAKLLPSSYVLELLQGVMARHLSLTQLSGAIVILLATAILGIIFNVMLFRWDSRQRLKTKKLISSITGIACIYILALVFAPQLTSAQIPEKVAKKASSAQVIDGVTVLDPVTGNLEPTRIVIEGDTVVAVGPVSKIKSPNGAMVTDYNGLFLLPGLIDSHVHLGGSSGGNTSLEEFSPEQMLYQLRTCVGVGVTSVVSMTDNPKTMGELADASSQGLICAPRVFYAGAAITAPGGHPASMFQNVAGLAEQLTRQVESEKDAIAAVDEMKLACANLIKLVLEEGWPGHELPQLKTEVFKAAIERAHQLNMKTTVHVHSDTNAQLAISMGIDHIEHIPLDLSTDTLVLMQQKGVGITPTLAVYEGFKNAALSEPVKNEQVKFWVQPFIIESLSSPNSWLAYARQSDAFKTIMSQNNSNALVSAKKLKDSKVLIVAGSDAGNPATFHGTSLIRELELLVEQGLQPIEAIAAATVNAGLRLGRKDLGTIQVGSKADFILMETNPKDHISALRHLKYVYLRGHRFDPSQLKETDLGSWRPSF